MHRFKRDWRLEWANLGNYLRFHRFLGWPAVGTMVYFLGEGNQWGGVVR